MRVLVVEDEPDLADVVARGLSREGMAVDTAYDGDEGYTRTCSTRYDVIVLDRDLPGMSGDELCRRVTAADNPARIIMLTASDSVQERVTGLSMGADDYLGKPFSFAELVARVRALYRRSAPAAAPVLTCGDVELDTGRRTMRRAGLQIHLAKKELAILEVLLMARGAVVTYEDLWERVWNSRARPDRRTIRVTVMSLRKKLGDPDIIQTVIGVGYRADLAGA